jgi:hypothetical protein
MAAPFREARTAGRAAGERLTASVNDGRREARDVPDLVDRAAAAVACPVEAGPVRPGGAASARRCESDDHQWVVRSALAL